MSMPTTPRLSADQCRAIAECLLVAADTADRGLHFAQMAEIAEREDWPCSATAPYQLLTREESGAIWNAPYWTRQRVFAPYLTKTQQAALRHDLKNAGALARKAFSS